MSASKKIILVIGATGAQGLAVIDALLKPSADGSPSPYAVRALTRNPESQRARDLAARGVEVVQGSTDDFDSVAAALNGAYGAYVNTDSFTIGDKNETFTGIRIFELAKQVKTIRHYVWSGLDNVNKITNYNPKYASLHYTAKARVSDWLHSQKSVVSDEDLSWSILATAPYMDMLKTAMFGPLKVRPDGTHVFAAPVGQGSVPLIALSDLGFFARYIFDNRASTSAQQLSVASDVVRYEDVVATFTKVTGQKAEYKPLSSEEWFGLFEQADVTRPAAQDTTTTWKETFTRFWAAYRDGVITRDLDWVRRVHPGALSLESWMRAEGYTGRIGNDLLKNAEEGRGPRPNLARIAAL